MKKILLISSVVMSLSLVGCNSMNNAMNDTSRAANATVGTGVKYTASAVGTGVGVISNTGATIGKGVGKVVDTGANVVGKTVSHH